MEFPLLGLSEINSSDTADNGGSLYSKQPVVASLYVGVLGVAAVVGTLGNLTVIITMTVKHLRSHQTTGNDVGRAFIANLASADLIVTSVINPLAIAGFFTMQHIHLLGMAERHTQLNLRNAYKIHCVYRCLLYTSPSPRD